MKFIITALILVIIIIMVIIVSCSPALVMPSMLR